MEVLEVPDMHCPVAVMGRCVEAQRSTRAYADARHMKNLKIDQEYASFMIAAAWYL